MSDYFARVRPLLGEGLSRFTIGVRGVSTCARTLELLGGSMLRRYAPREDEPALWPLPWLFSARPDRSACEGLEAWLRWKNPEDPLAPVDPDASADLEIEGVLGRPGEPGWAVFSAGRVTFSSPAGDLFGHLTLSHAVARRIRDALLGRAEWPSGRFWLGGGRWPFELVPGRSSGAMPPRVRRGAHVLVVGCGSVGSEATRQLSALGCRFTFMDGGVVSAFNPCRQWFGAQDVGQSKAATLAKRLGAQVIAKAWAPGDEAVQDLLERDRPDVVLLADGTATGAALAEELWRAGIPHVVGYAYPRARYFEVTTVVPAEATPCLSCLRGHLLKGAEVAPQIADEVSAFLYDTPDQAERDRRYTELVAEPATFLETSRLAQVVAMCAVEVLAGPRGRSEWFQRCLSDGTTCLLGANVVERSGDGEWAFGLERAEQVVRVGLPDIAGVEESLTCRVCGRELRVAHREALPRAAPDDEDRAMVAE